MSAAKSLLTIAHIWEIGPKVKVYRRQDSGPGSYYFGRRDILWSHTVTVKRLPPGLPPAVVS
jgi:hypothetical protein